MSRNRAARADRIRTAVLTLATGATARIGFDRPRARVWDASPRKFPLEARRHAWQGAREGSWLAFATGRLKRRSRSWRRRAAGRVTPRCGFPALLWCLGVLGMLWAEVSWHDRLAGLGSFRRLLAIPLLLAQFRRSVLRRLADAMYQKLGSLKNRVVYWHTTGTP